MSHVLSKELKIRPNDILDGWNVQELIVAYGFYMNEKSYKNRMEVIEMNKNSKKKTKVPEMYAVKFMTLDDFD